MIPVRGAGRATPLRFSATAQTSTADTPPLRSDTRYISPCIGSATVAGCRVTLLMGLPSATPRDTEIGSSGPSAKVCPRVEAALDVRHTPPAVDTVRAVVRETIAATERRIPMDETLTRGRLRREIPSLTEIVFTSDRAVLVEPTLEVPPIIPLSTGTEGASPLRPIPLTPT